MTHRFKLGDGIEPRSAAALIYEVLRVPTRDGGSLATWFVPCAGADRTILICHGAGANKGNFVWFLPPLAHRGFNLVLFDFRAHGASDGRAGTYGLRERDDVVAQVDWLKRERPSQATRIVGLGSSLGSMALALAAADDPRVDAVVLDSPLVSLADLLHHHARAAGPLGRAWCDLLMYEMGCMTGADFLHTSCVDAVRRIAPRPIFIVHGDDDVLMPRHFAERLHAAARGPCTLWLGPGPHSNIVTTAPQEYADRLLAFLAAHGLDPHRP